MRARRIGVSPPPRLEPVKTRTGGHGPRPRRTGWVVALLVACGGVPWPDTAAAQAPGATFTAQSDLVVMHVVVRDRQGAFVPALAPESFRIFDNGRPRSLGLFMPQEAPVTLGLVIDASGSMQLSRSRLAFAAAQFANAGSPADEVFAMVVGDRVRAVLPPERPFTGDVDVLREAILANLGARGRTALWDGVVAGLDYLARGTHARRALVVISDGQDNASTTPFSDVVERTRAANAAVYTIGLMSPADRDRRPRALRQLARESGGEAHFPDTHTNALEALDRVARHLHSAYTLGFAPDTSLRDGTFHKLRVDVETAAGVRLQARTRAGYLSAPRQREPPAAVDAVPARGAP